MPSAGETVPSTPSVFLSYASEDRGAARALRDALTAGGLEVWYDENELTGGDAWDQKIRRQIRECDFFMPIISAQSEARREGYFRREWRLAVERTLDMADDHLFLLPVVIDETSQGAARVPERFLTVQWLKVPGGTATAALQALCARIIAGDGATAAPAKRPPLVGKAKTKAPARALPPFPVEEPGKKLKYWLYALEWAVKSGWIKFQALPRFIRLLAYVWLAFAVLSSSRSSKKEAPETMSPVEVAKLKAIASGFGEGANKGDISKLGANIAREFAKELSDKPATKMPLLVVPFSAPADNPAEAKLANSTLATLYGRLSISHPGKVALNEDPLSSLDAASAQEEGKGARASYVIFGGIETKNSVENLTVSILTVGDGTVTWTKSYPVASADAETIAAEAEKAFPKTEDD